MSIQTGAVVVAVVAVVYGLGFAILPMRDWGESARSWYTLGGSGIIGVLALALIIVPWFVLRG